MAFLLKFIKKDKENAACLLHGHKLWWYTGVNKRKLYKVIARYVKLSLISKWFFNIIHKHTECCIICLGIID